MHCSVLNDAAVLSIWSHSTPCTRRFQPFNKRCSGNFLTLLCGSVSDTHCTVLHGVGLCWPLYVSGSIRGSNFAALDQMMYSVCMTLSFVCMTLRFNRLGLCMNGCSVVRNESVSHKKRGLQACCLIATLPNFLVGRRRW